MTLFLSMLNPRAWKSLHEYYHLRKWEYRVLNKDSDHIRRGAMYAVANNVRPQYLFGFTFFFLVAGIDIIASAGTELVGSNSPDQSAEFQRLLKEKKERQAEKQQQFKTIRETTETARAGGFSSNMNN